MPSTDIDPQRRSPWRICPNGCGSLTQQTVGPITFDRCRTCAGMFLDKALVDTLHSLPSTKLIEIDDAVVPSNILISTMARQRVDPRPCPNCRSLMLPYEVQSNVLVVLDKCGTCDGIWADDHELEAVGVDMTESLVHFGKKLSTAARDEIVQALYEQSAPRHPKVVEEAFADMFPTFAAWIKQAPVDDAGAKPIVDDTGE